METANYGGIPVNVQGTYEKVTLLSTLNLVGDMQVMNNSQAA